MKKKRLPALTGLLFLLAGTIVLAYPHVGQLLYKNQANQLISDYTDRMENTPEKEDNRDWLYELMVAYNKNLYENEQKNLIDPFSYQQPDFSLKQFGLGEEMIGYINIPKMNVQLPIYLGANSENMKKGAAHLTQTSLPVGGANTNAVIAAHRGMSTAAMFRNIEKLQVGDGISITNFRETLYYEVAEIKIISPTDIDEILIQPGRDIITLITCHPYRHNYQRYVVYCERV